MTITKIAKSSIAIALSYFLFLGQTIAIAQSTAAILPQGKTQFFDNNGKPLSSGKVYFYIPSTTTTKTTWQDSSKSIANANPVILDAGGRAIIYGDGTYRQLVRDRNNNIIYDVVTASTGTGSGVTGTGDGDLVGTIKPWAGLSAPNQYAFAYGQEVSRVTYSVLFTAITIQQTISCTSGNPTASGFSDTSQISLDGAINIGSVIESTCFPAGTRAISKTSTTVTFNNNSTLSTIDAVRIFLYGNGNGSTTFNLPDLRGYVIAGRCNMGGTACTNLTSTYLTTNSQATGAKGGSQSTTLATEHFPPYSPAGTVAYTPVGSISTPAITSSIVFSSTGTNSYTPAGTNNIPSIVFSSSGTNSYTPTGTNSTSTITGGTTAAIPVFPTGAGAGANRFLSDTATGVTATFGVTGTAAAQTFTGNAVTATSSASTFTGTGITATISSASSSPTFTGTPGTPIFTGTAQGGVSTPISNIQPTQTLNYIIKITPDSNSADASGVTSLGGMIGDIACGSGLTCTGNTISVSSSSSIFSQITINPTPLSYEQAFTINQSGPTTPSVAGPYAQNILNLTFQSEVTGSGSDSFGNNNKSAQGFRVNLRTGGSTLKAQIAAGAFVIGDTLGNITNPGAGDRIGLVGSVYSTSQDPVTTDTLGIYGVVAYNAIGPGGTKNWTVGVESDMAISSTASARKRFGFHALSIPAPDGTSNIATEVDTAYAISASTTATGWKNAIVLVQSDAGLSSQPLRTDANFIASDGAVTIADFINLSNLTVTGKYINFPNWTVEGTNGETIIGSVIGVNQSIYSKIKNVNTGTSASSGFQLENNLGVVGNFAAGSSTFSTIPLIANRIGIQANSGSDGIALITSALDPIIIAINNTEVARYSVSGTYNLIIPTNSTLSTNASFGAFNLSNINTGTSATVNLSFTNNNGGLASIGLAGGNFNTIPILQNRLFLNATTASSGIVLTTENSSDPIIIAHANVETVKFEPSDTTLTYTSDASVGPILNFTHNSTSPAVSDVVGLVRFTGKDSSGAPEVYAAILGLIADPTSGSEDGAIHLQTSVAGTLDTRFRLYEGLQIGLTPTGGDKGPGTGNFAGNIYINDVIIPTISSTNTLSNKTFVAPVLGAASATSINFGGSTLNAYTEGTCVPTLTFATPGDLSVVYSTRVCEWTRIGRMVTVNYSVTTTTFSWTTSSGALRITSTGLPGNVFAAASAFGTVLTQGITPGVGYTKVDSRMVSGGTFVDFLASGLGVGVTILPLTTAHTTSGTQVTLAGQIAYFM